MADILSINTSKLRDAAGNVKKEKTNYDATREEIDELITNTLGQYWGDEAYDELKEKFISKHRQLLQELGKRFDELNKGLIEASDDMDNMVNKLR